MNRLLSLLRAYFRSRSSIQDTIEFSDPLDLGFVETARLYEGS